MGMKLTSRNKIEKYLSITFINVTFTDYTHPIFINQGTCMFMFCTFTNNIALNMIGNYLVYNKGYCSFVFCNFTNNMAKNLVISEGQLFFNNCSFDNNTCSDKALIYNNQGCVFFDGCTFKDCGGDIVYNYLSANCIFNNCIINGSNVKPDNNGPVIIDTNTPEEGFDWEQFGIRIGICVSIVVLSTISTCFEKCAIGVMDPCRLLSCNFFLHCLYVVGALMVERIIFGMHHSTYGIVMFTLTGAICWSISMYSIIKGYRKLDVDSQIHVQQPIRDLWPELRIENRNEII